MADRALIELQATTTPANTDLLYIVIDPAGVPGDRKVTKADLLAALTTALTALTTRVDTVEIGEAAAIHDNVAGEINAVTEKLTPVAADLVIIEDSAASFAKKKVQVGNLPGGGGGGGGAESWHPFLL